MNGIDIFIHSLKEIDHIWVRLHFQQMPTVFQIAKNENVTWIWEQDIKQTL